MVCMTPTVRHAAGEGKQRSARDSRVVVVNRLPDLEGGKLLLLKGAAIVGEIQPDDEGAILIAPPDVPESSLSGAEFWVVAARELVLGPPFHHVRGSMWEVPLDALSALGDRPGRDNASPLFLFEDGQQLPYPHALHDDIAATGRGRFSHWESSLFFSSSDGTDPNSNGRSYRAIVATLAGVDQA